MKIPAKIPGLFILGAALLLVLGACGGEPAQGAEYALELRGVLSAPGVIDFAGLEMNVYQDFASNPCGDCADQPVSVYVGTAPEAVAEAMAEAITRADDIWRVREVRDGVLYLEEKTAGEAEEPPAPSAPAGLTVAGTYSPAK